MCLDPEKVALDYAARLRKMINKYSGELQIVMRTNFEKPRNSQNKIADSFPLRTTTKRNSKPNNT